LQVIINFLSNSLKFSQPGSEIHLHLEILENHVLANSEFRGKGFETSLGRSRSVAAIPNNSSNNNNNDSEEMKSLSGIVLSN
jgi:K+-sensing histidine kinase KdpD